MFEEEGEPPEEVEATVAATLDVWEARREHWQLHSEAGPNIHPEEQHAGARPWLSLMNPPDVDWESRWPDIDVAALRALFDERRQNEVEYDAPELCRETLGDDFQRLFVEMVLKLRERYFSFYR